MTVTVRVVPLGRPARFLMPSLKLREPMNGRSGETVQDYLENRLTLFGGYTADQSTVYGKWVDHGGVVRASESRLYVVAFQGKERIPQLCQLIAEVAFRVGETCIYLETGEDACLVYPVQTHEAHAD